MPRTIQCGSRVINIDAFKRGGKAVGIALAPNFAVGDDVKAGLFLGSYGDQGGIVLRLSQIGFRNTP